VHKVAHRTPEEIYWRDVRQSDGCWAWEGSKHNLGYGVIRGATSRVYAHRFAYEYFIGPIPKGFLVRQVCHTAECTNPHHLLTSVHSNSSVPSLSEVVTYPLLRDATPPPFDPFPNVEARFWSKVERTDNCWIWRGALTASGYGQVQFLHVKWFTHRLAYHLLVGPIPPTLTIDHLCRNRTCCNPRHLEVVSRAENTRREAAYPSRRPAPRTICKKGHPLTPDNTYISPKGGRRCRICRQTGWQSWAAKR